MPRPCPHRRGPDPGHYRPRPRKPKEPELPFPTEGQVFWTWFWIMLPLLALIAYHCGKAPEPPTPKPDPQPYPTTLPTDLRSARYPSPDQRRPTPRKDEGVDWRHGEADQAEGRFKGVGRTASPDHRLR